MALVLFVKRQTNRFEQLEITAFLRLVNWRKGFLYNASFAVNRTELIMPTQPFNLPTSTKITWAF